MKKFLLVSVAAVVLFGCAPPSGSTNPNPLVVALTNLANTGQSDLTSTIAVANAATPPDADGATCAQSGLTVVASMQKELAALPAGATVGVFTISEVASLYAPGSAQANYVVKTLETGCIGKLHDLNQAGMAATGVFATIGSVIAAGM